MLKFYVKWMIFEISFTKIVISIASIWYKSVLEDCYGQLQVMTFRRSCVSFREILIK